MNSIQTDPPRDEVPSFRTATPAMPADAQIAPVARLLADRARATMLMTLSDGRALPAGELARLARVSPPAASAHLAKLVAAGLLGVERRGRLRCYRLADPGIVGALEALAAVAPPVPATSLREAHAAGAVRRARMCYDHLAGLLGVRVTDALVGEGALSPSDRGYELTASGAARFVGLGVNAEQVAAAARRTRRPLARACLDWSERRPHLAGALGAALAARLLELGWLARLPGTRALRITNDGRRAFRRTFGIDLL